MHRVNVRRVGREQGAILIIAIGVLTLLAVLGTTFANLMRLERQATQNYIHSQEVDLINDSAVDAAIADLRGAENWYHFSSYKAPWLYKINTGEDAGELAHGMLPLDSNRAKPWEVIAKKQKYVSRYKTKVIDTSAQININGKQDTLGRMLDNLARAIEGSTRLHSPPNPLYSGPNRTGNLIRGSQVIEFRNRLEGSRFHSKAQLRELIGQENFEIIKDFVTVESWIDLFTYKADDGLDEIIDTTRPGASAGRGVGGGGTLVQQSPVANPASRMSPEPRSPVNINTAPEEVLIACIQGVGARRPFPYSRIAYLGIDANATGIGGQRIPGKEETATDVAPRGIWLYIDGTGVGIGFDKAKALAQRIIAERKMNPFTTWSTGDKSQPGGFQEFINTLSDNFFPAPEQSIAMDPMQPMNRVVDGDIRSNGSQEMTLLWQRGNNPSERTFRAQAGLPFHNRNAFFYEAVKGALVANFNPNSRINTYNPNAPLFNPVDKSQLVRLDRDRRTPRKGHTTEFCFDTNGIYEVTTLGEIAEAGATDASGNPPSFRSVYQKPVRTVVKIFDLLRHTNQFHFEKTFNTGDRSSRNNRRYVVTYPDPMTALTDAMTQGSHRDGNIQLAGLNDGRRLLTPPASRFQAYRTPESIIMAHGFQDREDSSYNQLLRMNRTGGGLQFTDEVLKVLNASFAKFGKKYRDFYTKTELSAIGGYGNPRAMNTPPNVDTEQMGTDLYPDGFHQSIFTASHLGGRFVHLPARDRIGQSLKSGPGLQVGASGKATRANDTPGNVAYHSGGLAFWVKFEFNGDDPIFSGLIGCTQVVEDVGMNLEDSEGVQFYIFKNTEGSLRIVRMYYHQAFPDVSGGDGGGGGEAITLWPPVEVDPNQQESPLDLDTKKIVARADYMIDIRRFRAHEWHHIAVDWNDQMPSTSVQVYLDFERVQGGGPYIPQAQVGDTPNAWVRLNCRRPRDELFIGGFIRSQGVSDGGIFKWFTNTAEATTGGGAILVDRPLKKILANATIDEFISYVGNFQGVRSYYGTGAPGYFTNQQADYANVFEVALPPEVDQVVLRSFDWTAYYPTFYTTQEGQILKIQTNPIMCQVFPGQTNIAPFQEPWRGNLRNVQNPVANRILMRRESKGLLGRNADLVYQFRIPPGRVVAGPLAGGAVQTPVIDDVTLTYFLPEPKILLQEEAE